VPCTLSTNPRLGANGTFSHNAAYPSVPHSAPSPAATQYGDIRGNSLRSPRCCGSLTPCL